MENKSNVIQIKNSDARALVTTISRFEHDPNCHNIRRGFKIQKGLAMKLHERANESVGECGIDEIEKFQKALPEYQVYKLSKEHLNALVYNGPGGGIRIYLYCHDDHYDVITAMTGFLSRSYFLYQE